MDSADLPTASDALPGNEPTEFRVTAPAEILGLLRTLLERQTRVTLGNAAGASLNTQLCALDAEHGALGLDVHAADPQLQSMLGADYVTAVAYLDHIRVEFELDGLVMLNSAEPGSGSVLRAAQPTQLYRFQRRQAFRVQPNGRLPQVQLPHPRAGEPPLRLRILDLSAGGLALLLPPDLPHWTAGITLSGKVELDRNTSFETQLRLQHIRVGDADGLRLGFAYVRLDPAASRDLQRYIDQTQKLSRLLRKS